MAGLAEMRMNVAKPAHAVMANAVSNTSETFRPHHPPLGRGYHAFQRLHITFRASEPAGRHLSLDRHRPIARAP